MLYNPLGAVFGLHRKLVGRFYQRRSYVRRESKFLDFLEMPEGRFLSLNTPLKLVERIGKSQAN